MRKHLRHLRPGQVDAYFQRFHFLLPVVDKPLFMRQYKQLMDDNGLSSDPSFVSCVFAIFACAARFVDDERLIERVSAEEGGMGMVYYERCVQL